MKHPASGAGRINSPRFALRRPYKILLCCLLNAALTVFAVFEGMQWTSARASLTEAMESRVYAGTLEPRTEGQERLDAASTLDEPVTDEIVDLLRRSPWVVSCDLRDIRAARFGDGMKYPSCGVQQYVMFVGRISGEMYSRLIPPYATGTGQFVRETGFQAVPSVILAGDPDAYPTNITEEEGVIVCSYENEDCVIPVEQDERYFFFGKKNIRTFHNLSADFTVWHSDAAGGIDAVLTRAAVSHSADASLPDAEFGAEIIREYGLEAVAARLDDAVGMIEAVEISSLENLLPYYNGKLRVPRGRMITEEDYGRRVCMVSVNFFANQHLSLGSKISLRLADTAYRTDSGGWRGIPDLLDDTALDYGKAAEYEVIGTFSNAGYEDYTILIPKSASSRDAATDSGNLTFTVRKDDYEHFLFETEPLLNEAGYNVILVRPDYADLEAQFDALEKNGTVTLVSSAAALLAGLALTAGMLTLFWRPEYVNQRILGATRREAGGIYASAFAVLIPSSLLVSALSVLVLGLTGLAPSLAPERLNPGKIAVLAAFALAELLLLCAITAAAALLHDRKRFGKGGRS